VDGSRGHKALPYGCGTLSLQGRENDYLFSSPSMGEDEGEGETFFPLPRWEDEDPDEVGKVRVKRLSSPSMGGLTKIPTGSGTKIPTKSGR